MTPSSMTDTSGFWDILHVALGLQHTASCLAEAGEADEAATCERQALSLMLEATCLLDPDEPALSTVRMLASAGVARLRSLQRRAEGNRRVPTRSPQPRRKTAALADA
jgi:hypothetical protein